MRIWYSQKKKIPEEKQKGDKQIESEQAGQGQRDYVVLVIQSDKAKQAWPQAETIR